MFWWDIKAGKNPRDKIKMRLSVCVDQQPGSDPTWNTKPRGHEWPNTSPSRDFAQFLGLIINSWVFPHHPGYLCYPTTLAHVENRTRRSFAKRIQQDLQFLQKTPENSQLKQKVASPMTKKTQQPHLLPAGMQPWGPWRSPLGGEALGEPKYGDNSKRQTLCSIFPNTWNIFHQHLTLPFLQSIFHSYNQ